MLLKMILTAVIIFIGFRLLNLITKWVGNKPTFQHHVSYLLPVLELFSWVTFLWWWIKCLIIAQLYNLLMLISILILIAAVPAFYLLRDFIFGIYLKIQRKITIGNHVVFSDLEGSIVKAGPFGIDLVDKYNDLKTIPYSKIRTKIITKQVSNSHLHKQIITFQLPATNATNQHLAQLLKCIINTPWQAASIVPTIENRTTHDDKVNLEIAVFVLKKDHAYKINDLVSRVLNLNNNI